MLENAEMLSAMKVAAALFADVAKISTRQRSTSIALLVGSADLLEDLVLTLQALPTAGPGAQEDAHPQSRRSDVVTTSDPLDWGCAKF